MPKDALSRMRAASQEQGFRRIEESIARKPAVRRALSSLEENTLIRTQQIWLREAERNVSPTTTSTFLSALTDEAISPLTVVRPPPLVLSSSLTETEALPEGWPPALKFSARLEAACSPSAPATLEVFAPAESDEHAHPKQVAQGERRLVHQGEGEAQDASGTGCSPERPHASSHAAAEPCAGSPRSPSRRGWPRPLLKASRAAAAVPVASPRRGSSSLVSSPRGARSPGTALLAELLDEAARQASSRTQIFSAPDKALHGKAPSVEAEAPAVSSGGAGSHEGRGGSDDSFRGGAGGAGGVSAHLSDAEGAAHRAARRAEQSRLELALARLSRHEAQGLRGEMQREVQREMHEQGAQLAELQLAVLRLHEEQRALIAAHRERQQRELSEVQACACIIS